MTPPSHVPVLADRIGHVLGPALDRPDAVFVDTTLGLGGHTLAFAQPRPTVHVIGVDRDPAALGLARERLAAVGIVGPRVTLVETTFDDVSAVMEAAGRSTGTVDAVLMDLGVSSFQLDTDDRGFAYSRDTPLDMRMGADGDSAADVLNTYDATRLASVFRDHAQERFASRLADAIVRERANEPFVTSGRLVELIYRVIPAPARRTGGHPAKRVFQALRMEVNDELGSLSRALPQWLAALNIGGRMAVLTYHSGEDRLVKRAFTRLTSTDAPHGLPVEPEPAPYRSLTRGGETADAGEIEANPRAASARLRAVERMI